MTNSDRTSRKRDPSRDIGPRLSGWYDKVQIIAVIAVVVVVIALRSRTASGRPSRSMSRG
jgi:hypothetical protein